MKDIIAVIGSGSWGTAMAHLISENGYPVRLWSYQSYETENLKRDRENKEFLPGVILNDKVSFSSDMQACMKDAKVVITAVPSHTMRQTAKSMAPFYRTGQIVVNISKGIEEGTYKRLSEVIKDEIKGVHLGVMSGPSHAEEVGRGIPTTNVVSFEKEEDAKYIQDIFMSPNFRIYTNTDMIGVEIGGSLKNVIALCAGISDGLGLGDNSKAALMTRGLSEMSRLGVKMGAKAQTFAGLSGVGDLIVTCTSMHSRNRRAGILIGQGKPLDKVLEEVHMVVEGVRTTKAAYGLAEKYGIEMPIVKQAYAVLFEGKSPRDAVLDLMTRDKKTEESGDWYQ